MEPNWSEAIRRAPDSVPVRSIDPARQRSESTSWVDVPTEIRGAVPAARLATAGLSASRRGGTVTTDTQASPLGLAVIGAVVILQLIWIGTLGYLGLALLMA